ncbi:hypothetical protein GCM10023149_32620 [Mucilaginibacter gynuensis]|uniref:PepSY-like beta-lactamase-inhibitor n=1 Tax=Mucilaginibacter gynuensis TaxID=1302236 RepID=A0ABP8GRK3_9SPHI
MKGTGYIFILILLFAACTGNRKPVLKADLKDSARHYLIKTLPNPASYKPLAYTDFDSIFYSYRNDKTYMRFDDSIMEVEAVRFRDMGENWNLFLERKNTGFYDKKQAYFKKLRDSVARHVQPRFTGYKLKHQFKIADTTTGDTVLNTYVFCFDTDGKLTNVLK